MNLNDAGNVVVPAYLALREKGYGVYRARLPNESERWMADGPTGRWDGSVPTTRSRCSES
ncbi:MAG TPA: hypothetical protein VGN72_10615 [Tepidisphaeraceae bacterium]|nr:hypothetical protein [Tepidisphaeraceae bacterium]